MHRVLLAIAIGSAFIAPATSKSFAAAGFNVSAFASRSAPREDRSEGVRIHRLIGVPAGPNRDGGRWRDRGYVYPYPADYYDSNYDIDRSWNSDSFNDWWHDRPDRAYPRWVWHNRNCTEERMWWSGAGWRCTP
jgi:hypothetical protein